MTDATVVSPMQLQSLCRSSFGILEVFRQAEISKGQPIQLGYDTLIKYLPAVFEPASSFVTSKPQSCHDTVKRWVRDAIRDEVVERAEGSSVGGRGRHAAFVLTAFGRQVARLPEQRAKPRAAS